MLGLGEEPGTLTGPDPGAPGGAGVEEGVPAVPEAPLELCHEGQGVGRQHLLAAWRDRGVQLVLGHRSSSSGSAFSRFFRGFTAYVPISRRKNVLSLG